MDSDGALLEGFLILSGHGVEDLCIDAQLIGDHEVAGSVVVRSNFVLNEVNVGDDVVLSTVEGTGLDCGVNVALCHCNTDAAHSVHQ